MLNRVKITDIVDANARNRVRGVLNARDGRVLEDTLNNLRRDASSDDLRTATRLFVESPLSNKDWIPVPFPDDSAEALSHSKLHDISLAKEAAVFGVRMRKHQDPLVAALSDFLALSEEALERGPEASMAYFAVWGETHGASVSVLAKAASVLALVQGDVPNDTSLVPYVSDWAHPRPTTFYTFLQDVHNQDFRFANTIRRYQEYISKGWINRRNASVLKDLFGVISDPDDLSITLQSYGTLSLFDGCYFLLRNMELLPSCVKDEIPDEIVSIWADRRKDLPLKRLASSLPVREGFRDYNFLRHLSAWRDVASVAAHEAALLSVIGERMGGNFGLNLQPGSTAIDGHEIMSRIKEGAFHPSDLHQNLLVLEDNSKFLKTVGLFQAFDRGSDTSDFSGVELLKTLENAVDVAIYAAANEIDRFIPRKSDDLLYSYVREAVIVNTDRGSASDFGFRKALQNIVEKEYNGNIVAFADYLHNFGGAVSEHLIDSCSDFVLSQLYHLFEKPNDVVEARAQLLEWRAVNTDMPIYKEIADALRAQIKLSRIMGDIRDNRIYVDPQQLAYRFSEDIVRPLISAVKKSDGTYDPQRTQKTYKNPVDGFGYPSTELPLVLQSAFEIFCLNNQYGIDSYIGRRIRHGTLEGVMTTSIDAWVKTEISKYSYSAPAYATYLEHWLETYKSAVDSLAMRQLHVRTKSRPDGLISPTIFSQPKQKIVDRFIAMMREHVTEGASTSSLVELLIGFCWFLLEEDLRVTRAVVREQLGDLHVKTGALQKWDVALTEDIKKSISQLNKLQTEKTETVLSWLKKPKSVGDSHTLRDLFDATVSEMKNRISGFAPKVVSNPSPVSVSGIRFQYFLDIIGILVANAAQHGDPTGRLGFFVEIDERGEQLRFRVKITSDIRPGDSEAAVREKIANVMSADVNDALVTETGTGIRKIRALIASFDILKNFTCDVVDRTVSGELTAELPLT